MDQALTPVSDNEEATFDLLTKTTGALAAVEHVKKVNELTSGGMFLRRLRNPADAGTCASTRHSDRPRERRVKMG